MAAYHLKPGYKIPVVELSGRFTIEHRDDFQQFLKDNIDFSGEGTAIDCAELAYIDSSGIGELLRFKMQAAKSNHTIYIAGLSDAIMKVFKMSQLNHVFSILSSAELESKFKA